MMRQTSPGIQMVQSELDQLLRSLGDVLDAHSCRYYLAYGTALGAARHQGFIPWDVDADVHIHGDDYALALQLLRTHASDEFELLEPGRPGYEHLFARLAKPGVSHMLLRLDLFPLDHAPRGALRRGMYLRSMKLLSQIFMVKVMDLNERRHYSPAKRRKALALKALLLPLRPAWLRRVAETVRALPSRTTANDTLVNSFGSYGAREYFPAAWFQQPGSAAFCDRVVPMPTEPEAYLRQLYGNFQKFPAEAAVAREVEFADQFYAKPLYEMGFTSAPADHE